MSNTNNQQVKNQVQTLIVPEKQQDNYIELGMKCVTPGLPRERLDEETQKQVEQVVQQQSIEIMKLSHNENNEKENLGSISEESDPNYKQHQPEMPTKINTESNASLKRGRVPAALDLHNQPDFFTKKLKSDNNTIQTATSEGNKPNVSIKYVGYNETPQYMAGGYSAGGYYNYPGYYPNEYMMMQQQYLLQMSYMNQNAYAAQGYQPEQMMGNGYPSYITPLTNQMQYNPAAYQPVYQHPELPQTGLGVQQKGPAPINDQEDEDQEDVEVDEEKEEVEEEDGEEGMEFKGIISINNDSFKFEFKTENEETVGKLQTEINNLNKEKFLRICEKTWNESYWLMKKREQFSNPTPTGLSAEIEVSHHGDEDEDEEDDEYYEEDDEQEEDYEEEEQEPAQDDDNDDDEDYEEEEEEPAQHDDDDEDNEEEEEEPAQDDNEEEDEDPEASEESKSEPVIESEGEAEEETKT